jgi:hypothetical protein
MNLRRLDGSESRFSAFVEGLVRVIGQHLIEQRHSISRYCTSLVNRLGPTRVFWPKWVRWFCRR